MTLQARYGTSAIRGPVTQVCRQCMRALKLNQMKIRYKRGSIGLSRG
jgi:hypothetical protein